MTAENKAASPPAREEAPAEWADEDLLNAEIAGIEGLRGPFAHLAPASADKDGVQEICAKTVLVNRMTKHLRETGDLKPGEEFMIGEPDSGPNGGRALFIKDAAPALAAALRNRTSEPEAGEAYGWVYEELAPGPDWCAGLEWWPAKFTKKPPKPETSRNVVPLYTHPAPATADKLRGAVEALERIERRRQTSAYDEVEAWELQDIARQALAALNDEG